jgi:hypothetical protein
MRLPLYTKLLNIKPEHYLAYNQRSSARSAIKDYQGAMDDAQKAKSLLDKFSEDVKTISQNFTEKILNSIITNDFS